MNEVTLSVIVPYYNRIDVIEDCFTSIFNSNYKKFEVIAVDDNSSDNSSAIVKSFPLNLVSLKENVGAGRCRNAGAKIAKGEILVFVDSDVLIRKDALKLVVEDFDKLSQISVVQGIYSKECQYKNFVNKYSNLHYHFYGMQIKKEYISSVASYFMAIKKDIFCEAGGFDEDINTAKLAAEDQLLGYNLNRLNFKIYLDKRILVEHRKNYSLAPYLIHDIQTGNNQMFRFLTSNTEDFIKHIFSGEVGTLIPTKFVYGVILAFFIFLTALLYLFITTFWVRIILITEIVFFYLLNGKYLYFVYKDSGWLFFLKSAVLTYLKMLFAGFGCVEGVFNFCLQRSKKKHSLERIKNL